MLTIVLILCVVNFVVLMIYARPLGHVYQWVRRNEEMERREEEALNRILALHRNENPEKVKELMRTRGGPERGYAQREERRLFGSKNGLPPEAQPGEERVTSPPPPPKK